MRLETLATIILLASLLLACVALILKVRVEPNRKARHQCPEGKRWF